MFHRDAARARIHGQNTAGFSAIAPGDHAYLITALDSRRR
jgi:hypothetical protein